MVGGRNNRFDTYRKIEKKIHNRTLQLDQECLGKHPTRIRNLLFQKVLHIELTGWNGR